MQQIHLFDTKQYDKRPFTFMKLEENTPDVKNIKFSYNGNYLLLITAESCIIILDAYAGKRLFKFTGNWNETGLVPDVGFTPDCRYVYTGGDNGHVTFFNLEEGGRDREKEIALMDFHPKNVPVVRFSHLYCLLVSGCQNLVVWIPDRMRQ